jgi:hypothetical protein
VDHLADQLRPALAKDSQMLAEFDQSVVGLKTRIAGRVESVARELQHPNQPLAFGTEKVAKLSGWRFKTGITRSAGGRRAREANRELLQVVARGTDSTGSWRTLVLLEDGHYEFSGKARTEGLTDTKGAGVILRVSGEKSPKGISATNEWTVLSYEFDIRGVVDAELVCEFRGRQGLGMFEAGSLQLIRKGPRLDKPELPEPDL